MHKDKGKEKWEIFAWAMRHAMARVGEIGLDDTQIRDKLMYEWNILAYFKMCRVSKRWVHS